MLYSTVAPDPLARDTVVELARWVKKSGTLIQRRISEEHGLDQSELCEKPKTSTIKTSDSPVWTLKYVFASEQTGD